MKMKEKKDITIKPDLDRMGIFTEVSKPGKKNKIINIHCIIYLQKIIYICIYDCRWNISPKIHTWIPTNV